MIEAIWFLLVSSDSSLEIPPNSTPAPYEAEMELPLPVEAPIIAENSTQIATSSLIGVFIPTAYAYEATEPINEETCVSWVRKRIIKQFPRVEEAKDLIPTSDKPDVGSVAIFSYEPSGHLARVVRVNQDSFDIEEYGFRKDQTTERNIKNNDKFLIGFWR